jgi:hypothetical protein
MEIKKQALLLFLLIIGKIAFSQAPQVTYSEPDRNDSRRTEFEIIGKLNGNFLIYKKNQSDHSISVYDEDMKLKGLVKLDYIPDRWINIDFVSYPDFAYMIYQYQRRSTVYCMGVKLDAEGKKIGEPFEMDTTGIGFAANNKIYTTVNSDDKKKIMVFKINSKNTKNFYFTTLLYDNNLQLLHKDRMSLPMEERSEYFSDFMLSNEGELCFAKFIRPGNNSEYISKVFMVTKAPDSGFFAVRPVDIGPRLLDELKLKVDNSNKRLLVNAFFYKERRGNIDGLYTLFWDKATNSKISDTVVLFDDNFRNLAKSADGTRKAAFDDYYIKNITIRRDGGFLLVGESLYSTSRGSTFNRWDYWRWGNPWMSPMDYYYSPYYYNPWYMPWGGRYGYGYPYGYNNNNTRYNANNIMILSLDKNGRLEWNNVIEKSQYDDETDNMISFQTMNTGSEIHFLFNQYEKRMTLLTDQSIDPDGKITRNPTLKNLDKGYDFMPRFAKQVSASQMIVPCTYRNSLCFAKIEW